MRFKVKGEIDVVVGIGRWLEQEADRAEGHQRKPTRSLGIVFEQHGKRQTETRNEISAFQIPSDCIMLDPHAVPMHKSGRWPVGPVVEREKLFSPK
jgi:hypothetical protein